MRCKISVTMAEYKTMLLKSDQVCVQASGWVNDSEPEAEFRETVNKRKAMLKAVAQAETLADNP